MTQLIVIQYLIWIKHHTSLEKDLIQYLYNMKDLKNGLFIVHEDNVKKIIDFVKNNKVKLSKKVIKTKRFI